MLMPVTGPAIDPRHVEAALAGDDVAVRHIVSATQADVRRLCALLGSGQDAELFNFATDVDTGQRAEIRSMQTLLNKKP